MRWGLQGCSHGRAVLAASGCVLGTVWSWALCVCSSRRSGRCWELLGFVSLWFVSGRFVQCCCIPNNSCLMICFLCFQTVAEIVKELAKNEKIRVQLELNKSGENVSWSSLFLNWGTDRRNCSVGTQCLPVTLLWQLPELHAGLGIYHLVTCLIFYQSFVTGSS